MSPVEAFSTGIKIFNCQKVCLFACLSLTKFLFAMLIFLQVNVKLEPRILDPFYFRSLEVTLIQACCGTERVWLARLELGLVSQDSQTV